MSSDKRFTSENLDFYLKELGKEFRKLCGKSMPAEIILIGGASVLANYGFRDLTTDMDAIVSASSAIKDAINRVRDKHELPHGWLNADFKKTKSYSQKLVQYSVYYKTFSNVLTVRTVSAEYLIAMKLKSGRRYKNDLSDMVGIMEEHSKRGTPLNYVQIDKAVCNLYGSWDGISAELKAFVKSTLNEPDYTTIYNYCIKTETTAKRILREFERDNPNVLNESNINTILDKVQEKKTIGKDK